MSETHSDESCEKSCSCDPRKVFAVAVRPDLHHIITTEAKSRGISRSALVRLAVMHYVAPSKPRKETRANG